MATTGRAAEDIGHEGCGQKDPNYTEEDCLNETKCSNCLEELPMSSRSCEVYQKRKK